jgi:hypothetical protein
MSLIEASHSLHYAKLTTAGQKPLFEGEFKHLAQWALTNLQTRFPGLKIVKSLVSPSEVRVLLDFQRLDEDVLRVLQSYKSEVKNLLKKKGFAEENLWQWNYEERWISTPDELADVEIFL